MESVAKNGMENHFTLHFPHENGFSQQISVFSLAAYDELASGFIYHFPMHSYDDNHIMKSAMINDDIKSTRLFINNIYVSVNLNRDF